VKTRFVASQLRHRPGRALTLGIAIFAASASFIVLAAAGKTSGLEVHGAVKSNFRPAYDVLVRPHGSATSLERDEHLVRDNYLSGIFGGITLEQYERIKALSGVEVAAPIANVGYILPVGDIPVSIGRFVSRDPVQLYRVRFEWLAHAGTSSYPAGEAYVYYNRVHRFTAFPAGDSPGAPEEIVPGRGPQQVCGGFVDSTPQTANPFAPSHELFCFSSRTPRINRNNFHGRLPMPNGVGVVVSGTYPILLAAIDPVQEQRLLHLDRAVVRGRYLRKSDRVRTNFAGRRSAPVLVSTRPYVHEMLRATVERLRVRRPREVPQLLTAGLCRSTFIPCPRESVGRPPRGWPRDTTAYSFLTTARGQVVGRTTLPIAAGYRRLLAGPIFREVNAGNYWTVSEPRYRRGTDGTLEPRVAANSPEMFTRVYRLNAGIVPPESRDLQFRKLRGHAATGRFLPTEGTTTASSFSVVGRYDPTELPGFSHLSKVPLETYYPPLLRPHDRATVRALHGQPLAPTQNLGDYMQQPPLMLTTIRGLKTLFDGENTSEAPIATKAPISAIRVRVAGVTGPDGPSRARIESVALRIHAQTGLDVDVTAGSSPHPLTIRLPPGKFGRPALALSEGWIQKGVSASFLSGVGRKQLALFVLIPLICCLFLANGAYAAARTRRAEMGTLLSLGWSRRAVFAAVLGEILLIGVVAGVVGVGVAAALVRALSLETQLLAMVLVLPVALAIALLAGFVPAWSAAHAQPLAAFRLPVAEVKRGGRVSDLTGLALLNLRRVPARALVAGGGLAFGAAALTVLLAVQHSFQGVLAGTLLGDAIAFQIGGFDYLAVALVVGLAAVSVADVVYLNLRERQAELVTLRTLGWSELHLVRLVCVEVLALASGATLLGAAAGVAVGAASFDVPLSSLAVAGLAAAGSGVLAALVASLLPLSQIQRLTPPAVLAADE
jgi:putative ABC transport system permease protein